MFWRVRGNGRKGAAFQAISAIDNAIWDIKAKALKVPLYRLLSPGACACADLRFRWLDKLHDRRARS